MKIIFLNTWGGKQKAEIQNFFKLHAPDTDVFCLQEAYDDLRTMIRDYIQDFKEIHEYQFGFEDETGTEDFAQATYIRQTLPILDSKIVFNDGKLSGLGIATEIKLQIGETLHILNYHGISRPKDKLDNPDRLGQSQKILDYYQDKSGPKILGGDFNILPKTKSIKMFQERGYRELVEEYKIPTTRNHLYWDKRPQKHLSSDYIFLSDKIEVKSFLVPSVEISDHLPLILEANLVL